MRKLALALALVMAAEGAAIAHHSFAVFFDETKVVTITGTVTGFQFVNPHGVIDIDVTSNGKVEHWRAETNAPVVLRRRGWSKDSLKVGETVTLVGWASRDGRPYIRLRQATHADGTAVGKPFDTSG